MRCIKNLKNILNATKISEFLAVLFFPNSSISLDIRMSRLDKRMSRLDIRMSVPTMLVLILPNMEYTC